MSSANNPIRSSSRSRLLLFGSVLLIGVIFLPGCILLHRHPGSTTTSVAPSAQPDRILLDEAMNEFKHGRYDVGRLTLQTLINTYPDSEYLSQAKLATANSYYKQGGISGLTEAEAEYKDFITFFPTAPEAPMAEYRAGMCHFRLMGKEDRDQTEAQEAATEFKQFLTQFPNSPLVVEVKGRLREAQEVLAEGDYEIAMFYYNREAWPAAESRLKDVAGNYPNFSEGDQVFWYLGQTLTHLNKKQEATPYYDRLVMEFPLSPLVVDAKQQLGEMHKPIPTPTKAMLARAEADATHHEHPDLLQRTFSVFSGAPDFSRTLRGPVVLGSPYQIQTEIAKLNGMQPPSTPAPAGRNALSAQTVSMASFASGKPIDPTPPKSTAASTPESSSSNSQSKESLTRPTNSSSTSSTASEGSSSSNSQKKEDLTHETNSSSTSSTAPEKKSGKFHFLKKLIP